MSRSNKRASTLSWVTTLGILLSLVGCSSTPATPPESSGASPQTEVGGTTASGSAGRTGAAGSTTAGTHATGAAASGGRAGVGAAGSVAAGVAGAASTAGAGGSDAAAGAGGTDSAAAGSAAAGSGGADAAAGAGGSGNPLTLPEPDQTGPYEVQLDQPVGEGFGVPIASSDTGDGVAGCKSFAEGFGGDPADTMKLIQLAPDLRMDLYSLYRPAVLEEGKTYPLITWGNGTCAKPEGYDTLLRHVASHGFFVIAANSRQVGQNSPMTKALDWAAAANKDAKSPYFGKIDLERIGAMGHSQGGMATIAAAKDARVKSVIIWNGGTSATKQFLAVSGDRDLVGAIDGFKRGVNAAPKAGYLWYHKVPGDGSLDGHLTLMVEPERVVGPAAAWFRYTLQDDAVSRAWFVGTDCKLCNHAEDYEYGQKGL